MSLNFASIESAYVFGKSQVPNIQFDVVTSFQETPTNSFSSLSSGNNTSNTKIKKQYFGVVIINSNTKALSKLPDEGINGINGINTNKYYEINEDVKSLSGFSYEIYDNNGDEVMKGKVTDTNLNTITFPISDLNKDYFINVDVEFTIKKVEKIAPLQTSLEDYNVNNLNTSKNVKNTEKLFKIFYTRKILNNRKQNNERYLQSKNSPESNTRSRTYYDLIDEREKDLKRFTTEQIPKSAFIESTSQNQDHKESMDVLDKLITELQHNENDK